MYLLAKETQQCVCYWIKQKWRLVIVWESGFQICKRKVQKGKLFLEMEWIVLSCVEVLIVLVVFFFLIVRELQFIFRVLVYFANSAFQQQFLLLEKLVLIFYILMF